MTDPVRGVNLVLAQYKNLREWQPKVTDFLIWHGWLWGRWYGIVSGVNDRNLIVIKEGLPSLLFMVPEDLHTKKSIEIPTDKVRNAARGEFHVLQEGVWYI